MAYVYQGDKVKLLISGSGFTLSEVTYIDFAIGNLCKRYPATVTYDSTTEKFSFPLTAEETQSMIGKKPFKVQLHYTSGDIRGVDAGEIDVLQFVMPEVSQ